MVSGPMNPPGPDWQHPQWLLAPPTPDEQAWAIKWMREHNAYEGEWMCQWKVIDDMLRAAGYVSHPGGGPENDDLVRDLIHRAMRTDKIAEMHRKNVDQHGGTWGDCNECGWAWPCPTYEAARSDSTKDYSIDSWHPEDNYG
jgi:hypothetical protein